MEGLCDEFPQVKTLFLDCPFTVRLRSCHYLTLSFCCPFRDDFAQSKVTITFTADQATGQITHCLFDIKELNARGVPPLESKSIIHCDLTATPPRFRFESNNDGPPIRLFFKFEGPDRLVVVSHDFETDLEAAPNNGFRHFDAGDESFNRIRWVVKRDGPSMARPTLPAPIAPDEQPIAAAVAASPAPSLSPAELLLGKWQGTLTSMMGIDPDNPPDDLEDEERREIQVMVCGVLHGRVHQFPGTVSESSTGWKRAHARGHFSFLTCSSCSSRS